MEKSIFTARSRDVVDGVADADVVRLCRWNMCVFLLFMFSFVFTEFLASRICLRIDEPLYRTSKCRVRTLNRDNFFFSVIFLYLCHRHRISFSFFVFLLYFYSFAFEFLFASSCLIFCSHSFFSLFHILYSLTCRLCVTIAMPLYSIYYSVKMTTLFNIRFNLGIVKRPKCVYIDVVGRYDFSSFTFFYSQYRWSCCFRFCFLLLCFIILVTINAHAQIYKLNMKSVDDVPSKRQPRNGKKKKKRNEWTKKKLHGENIHFDLILWNDVDWFTKWTICYWWLCICCFISSTFILYFFFRLVLLVFSSIQIYAFMYY